MRTRIAKRAHRILGTAGSILIMAAPGLPAQSVAWTGSLYGATGDYIFTERSSTVAITTGLALTTWRLRLSASLPVILQSTPWVAMGGAGPIPTGGPMHGTVGEQSGQWGGHHRRGLEVPLPTKGIGSDIGIGDPVLFGAIDLLREGGMSPSLTLTAGVKAPLASAEKGFGTGEWDVGAGLALSRALGRTMVFLDGSYWLMGDMPALPLNDVLTYGLGIGRILGDGDWSALVSFAGGQATIEGSDDPAQLAALLGHRWQSGTALSGSLSFGLTSSSPDLAASLSWRVPIGRRAEPPLVAIHR